MPQTLNITKLVTLLIVLVTFNITTAQVGIGTTNPNSSASLEIYSTNSGLLIPRVALTSNTDQATISNPADYLLVFNTATVTNLAPGLVYWKDGSWKRILNTSDLSSGSGSGWALTGNSISDSDFLGTTNWAQLNLKANSVIMAQFHPNGGVGLGRNANINGSQHSFAIGENANATGNQDAYAFGTSANATGNQSMALGKSAYTGQTDAYALGTNSNATGNKSMALGYAANATATNSYALGISAQSTGYQSFALGIETLANNNNTYAIGYSTEATGLNAMAFGYDASASGQNAVAIGYQAVANNANTVILGNTSSDSWYRTKVGIGTTNPTANLEVSGSTTLNGTLKYTNGTQGAGKVLMSDANGNASWVNASVVTGSSIAYGEVYSTSTTPVSITWSGSPQPLNFGTSNSSTSVTVNSTNLQPTVTGLYRTAYNVTIQKGSGGSIDLEIYLATGWNSSDKIPGSSTYVSLDSNTNIRSVNINKFVQLSANQQIYVFYRKISGNTDQFYLLPEGSSFNIERVNQ